MKKMKKYIILLFCLCLAFGVLVTVNLINASFQPSSTKYKLNKSDYITEQNRHLIGKETLNDESTTSDSITNLLKDKNNNDIVRNIDKDILEPSSIEVFKGEKKSNIYITPEIITINGSINIFTKEDGTGWELNSGDSLIYHFEKYKSEAVKNQVSIIGYIKNGQLVKGENFDKLSGTYTISADEKGTYYIYILNCSSDSISFKKGSIKQK